MLFDRGTTYVKRHVKTTIFMIGCMIVIATNLSPVFCQGQIKTLVICIVCSIDMPGPRHRPRCRSAQCGLNGRPWPNILRLCQRA